MTPQREEWTSERLDEKFAEVDSKLAELNRQTGPASNQAVLVAAIGAAAVVVAAVIAAYVQLKTHVPVPIPPTK